MTPEELIGIEERLAAATPGPWTHHYHEDTDDIFSAGGKRICGFCCCGGFINKADGDFAAAAREDVPKLVAEVKRLQSELSAALQTIGTQTIKYDNLVQHHRKMVDKGVEMAATANALEDRLNEVERRLWEYEVGDDI